MTSKSDLKPSRKERVIDTVRNAGIDVSDWQNMEGGARRAPANPKYCYEWSFVDEARVVVNLWYPDIVEIGDQIQVRINMRKSAQFHSEGKRTIWKKRAQRFDDALKHAFEKRIPVRAVICDGEMRDRLDLEADPSRVEKRQLDSVVWAVTSYDSTTGEAVITREPEIGATNMLQPGSTKE